jgi:hypothetical protein
MLQRWNTAGTTLAAVTSLLGLLGGEARAIANGPL